MSRYLRKRSSLTGGTDGALPITRPLDTGTELVYVRQTYTIDLSSVQGDGRVKPSKARRAVWNRLGQMAETLHVRLTRLDSDWQGGADGRTPGNPPEMVPVSLSGPAACVQECLEALGRAGYPVAQIAPQSRGKDGGWVSHAECTVPRVGAGLTPKLVKRPKLAPKADCTGAKNALLGIVPRPLEPLETIPNNPPRPAKWYGADATVREVEQLLRDVSRIGVVTTGELPTETDKLVSVPAPPAVLFRTQNVLSGIPDVLSPGQFEFLYGMLYLAHYGS